MKLVTTTLLSLFSLSIYAQESKYEVLKDAYETAFYSAVRSDFEYYHADPTLRKMKCVLVDQNRPDEFSDVVVAIFDETIPGNPGEGPLFPTTGDQYIGKVFVGHSEAFVSKNYPFFENNMTNTDFEITDAGSSMKFSFRKKDNYLPFKVSSIASNGKLFDMYFGYCYKK